MSWKRWFSRLHRSGANGSEMSWNEPGGGKGKDPWGGGNNNQGPPDLDEALKKFQENLSKMFGGKGGSNRGGSGGAPANPAFFLGIIGVGVALVLVWSAAYQVQQAERAVVLRTGKFYKIEDAGLKFKIPVIDEVFKVNVQAVRSMQLEASMLTADNNIVYIALQVQYQISDPKSYLLEVAQGEETLRHTTESALRNVVGGMTMDAVVIEQREIVANEVELLLQQNLNHFKTGININKVSLKDASPPQAVKTAFDDVIKAREDEIRLKNEAEAYSNSIIPVARGLAKRQLEEAEGYKQAVVANAEGEANRFERVLAEYQRAPEVTRKRLYMDAMQEVMENSSKVLVDVGKGDNFIYLPLDQLMNQRNVKVDQSAKAQTNEVLKEAGQSQGGDSGGADRLRQLRESRREVR